MGAIDLSKSGEHWADVRERLEERGREQLEAEQAQSLKIGTTLRELAELEL